MSQLRHIGIAAFTVILMSCSDDGGDDRDSDPPDTDVTAPSVTLAAPGGLLNRTVTLTASAEDDVGVTQVDFLLDGAELASDTSAPYSVDWDSSTVEDGEHELRARAHDAAGNTGQSEALSVSVGNQRSYTLTLSAMQEVPQVDSAASGSGLFEVNLATGAIEGGIEIMDMTATAAHLHDSFAGSNGGVQVALVQDAADASRFEVAAGSSLDAAQVERLLAGAFYVNAHSEAHPGGEVRAQLFAAPVEVLFTSLDGAQVVPPVTSAAGGLAATTLDTSSGALVVHLNTQGADDATAAELRSGDAGSNGPVLLALAQDAADPAHWSAEADLDADALQDYQDGRLYVNLKTPDHPDGEIRGQILPDGAPEPPAVTLSELQASIFTPSCSGCHNGSGGALPGSMDLSSAVASFANLVDVSSTEVPTSKRVLPGNADDSYLVHKLEGTQSVGARMPLGGPFLSEAMIAKVRQWIDEGAMNN